MSATQKHKTNETKNNPVQKWAKNTNCSQKKEKKKKYKCPPNAQEYSISLATRKMKIKTTMRYCLIPVRKAFIQNKEPQM